MKTALLVLLMLMASFTESSAIDPVRMKIVQAMIDSAKTQADLNNASRILFETWQEELEEKEKQLEDVMPKKESKRFRETMKLWKGYVEGMSRLRSEMFKNDMTEPAFYKMRGLESKAAALRNAKKMHPYVYNMSRAIYYEEKWMELDAMINTK